MASRRLVIRVSPVASGLWLVAGICVAGAAWFVPPDQPVAGAVLLGLAALGGAGALANGCWRRRLLSGRFPWGGLALSSLLLAAVLVGVFAGRYEAGAAVAPYYLRGLGSVAVLLVLLALPAMAETKGREAALRRRLRAPGPGSLLADGVGFALRETWGLARPVACLALAALAAVLVATAACAAVVLGFHWLFPPQVLAVQQYAAQMHPFAQVAVAAWAAFLFYVGVVFWLAIYRLVAARPVTDRFTMKRTWYEADQAGVQAGFLATLSAALWVAGGALVLVLAAYHALVDWGGMPDDGLATIAASAALAWAAAWPLVLVPMQWTFAIMSRYDCGWMRAMEAAGALFGIEPRRALAVGLPAMVLTLSGVGIIASRRMLLQSLEGLHPLVEVLLHTRRIEDVERELDEDPADPQEVPRTVAEGYELLESGRPLDAINKFQQFRYRKKLDPLALRGEALGFLQLGNVREARVRLEMWQRVDPGSGEPARLLREVADGLWDEGGGRPADKPRRHDR